MVFELVVLDTGEPTLPSTRGATPPPGISPAWWQAIRCAATVILHHHHHTHTTTTTTTHTHHHHTHTHTQHTHTHHHHTRTTQTTHTTHTHTHTHCVRATCTPLSLSRRGQSTRVCLIPHDFKILVFFFSVFSERQEENILSCVGKY
jgi:hypothetical protein